MLSTGRVLLPDVQLEYKHPYAYMYTAIAPRQNTKCSFTISRTDAYAKVAVCV